MRENPLRLASQLALDGRPAEAVACLEATLARTRASATRPANTSLIARTAALFCERIGDYAQAAAYYEEALSEEPNEPLTLIALAGARWSLAQPDLPALLWLGPRMSRALSRTMTQSRWFRTSGWSGRSRQAESVCFNSSRRSRCECLDLERRQLSATLAAGVGVRAASDQWVDALELGASERELPLSPRQVFARRPTSSD